MAQRGDRRYNRCVAGSIAVVGRKNCLTGMMVLLLCQIPTCLCNLSFLV